MTAVNFCYWLQGYFELTDPKSVTRQELDDVQISTIRRHLAMVFAHDIDPKAGPPAHQHKLDGIHTATTAIGATDTGVTVRC